MPSPIAVGAVQLTLAPPSRGVTLTAVGAPGTPAVGRTRIDGALGAVRWGLSEEESSAAWSAGQKMGLDEAIAYALEREARD